MGDKKLRIVFLSRFVGSVNRGVETFCLELSKRLAKNHEVSVLTGNDSDSLNILLKGSYDLVIPTNGRLQALNSSFGRFFSKYKTLISGQAGIGKDDIWNIAVTGPDVYVALTDYEMIWAKKWSWRTKIVKIPNGVDLKRFSPVGEKISLDLEKPIILSVGALEWYKYHDRSIKAISELKKGSILIIGTGSQKDYLQKMGESLLGEKRFKMLEVSYKEIDKYYRSSDLFTLPSWIRESFGIAYVEAMACGLAVVAPNDPPRREIIGKAGVLVDTQNKFKFAKGLETALNTDWKNILKEQSEKFSWDKVALQYEQLIEELFL